VVDAGLDTAVPVSRYLAGGGGVAPVGLDAVGTGAVLGE